MSAQASRVRQIITGAVIAALWWRRPRASVLADRGSIDSSSCHYQVSCPYPISPGGITVEGLSLGTQLAPRCREIRRSMRPRPLRQREGERRALADFALHPDLPSV